MYLVWSEVPSEAHQNKGGLQICFLFVLVDVHMAEIDLVDFRLRFLVYHSTERQRQM